MNPERRTGAQRLHGGRQDQRPPALRALMKSNNILVWERNAVRRFFAGRAG